MSLTGQDLHAEVSLRTRPDGLSVVVGFVRTLTCSSCLPGLCVAAVLKSVVCLAAVLCTSVCYVVS